VVQLEGLDDAHDSGPLQDLPTTTVARIRVWVLVNPPGFRFSAEPRVLQVVQTLPEALVADALAVQAANGTNSATDRQAIQAEVSQLAQEIDRTGRRKLGGQGIIDVGRKFFNKDARAAEAQVQMQKGINTKLETALAPLMRNTGLRGMMQYLQEGGSDKDLMGLIGSTFGIKDEKVQAQFLAVQKSIQGDMDKYQAAMKVHMASRPVDPGSNANPEARKQYETAMAAWQNAGKSLAAPDMKAQMDTLVKLGGSAGIDPAAVNPHAVLSKEQLKIVADPEARRKYLAERYKNEDIGTADQTKNMTEEEKVDARIAAGKKKHDAAVLARDPEKWKAYRKEIGAESPTEFAMTKSVLEAENAPKKAQGAGGQPAFPDNLTLKGTLQVVNGGKDAVVTATAPVTPVTGPSAPAVPPTPAPPSTGASFTPQNPVADEKARALGRPGQ
jgi:flagellin-like hook-associated protein FlgL